MTAQPVGLTICETEAELGPNERPDAAAVPMLEAEQQELALAAAAALAAVRQARGEVPAPIITRPGKSTMVIVGLALVTSLVSATTMIYAVTRLGQANALIERGQAQEAKLARLNMLVTATEQLRLREQRALQRLEMLAAGRPATAQDMSAAFNELRGALARYQPGSGPLLSLREGQNEVADRLGVVLNRLDRLEQNGARPTATTATAPIAQSPSRQY
jgi:hypothetical protein